MYNGGRHEHGIQPSYAPCLSIIHSLSPTYSPLPNLKPVLLLRVHEAIYTAVTRGNVHHHLHTSHNGKVKY